VTIKCVPQHILFSGFESSERHGPDKHSRGPSATELSLPQDKVVRRSAQDDDSVGF
jgi:hypothetical protein